MKEESNSREKNLFMQMVMQRELENRERAEVCIWIHLIGSKLCGAQV